MKTEHLHQHDLYFRSVYNKHQQTERLLDLSKLDNPICGLTKDELNEIKQFFTDYEKFKTDSNTRLKKYITGDEMSEIYDKTHEYNIKMGNHVNIFITKLQEKNKEIEQEYSDKIISLINYYNDLTNSLIENNEDSLI